MKNINKTMIIIFLAIIFFIPAACDSSLDNDNKTPVPIKPAITTVSLPDGEAGEPYEAVLTATGDDPITWSLDGVVSLPTGLTLSADGIISGTPVSSANVLLTVKAANAAGDDIKYLSLTIDPAPLRYIITSNGAGGFVTKKFGFDQIITTLTDLDNNISTIKTAAYGEDCIIQFGDNTEVLDIGDEYIDFDGSGTPGWGLITLKGKITSEGNTLHDYTIKLENNVSIDSGADIKKAGAGVNSYAVWNAGSGTLNIIGGTIEGTGDVIYNDSSGSVNITGGIVSATMQIAIHNYGSEGIINISGGEVYAASGAVSGEEINISGGIISTETGTAVSGVNINISGGTISSNTGIAIQNYGGKLTITEDPGKTTLITSKNSNTSDGTINIKNDPGQPELGLIMTGGRVENTASGHAIYNEGDTALEISGGTVSANQGTAIYHSDRTYTSKTTIYGTAIITSANTGLGTIYIAKYNTGFGGTPTPEERLVVTGGTVSNTTETGYAIYNDSDGTVKIEEPAIILGEIY